VQVGPFQAAQMVTPQQLEALNEQQDWAALDALLLPMDAGLQGLPSQVLDAAQQKAIMYGQSCQVVAADAEVVKLYAKSGQLLGIGEIVAGELSSRRLINLAALAPVEAEVGGILA
jgi:tRNA pseudouridine55 synthase